MNRILPFVFLLLPFVVFWGYVQFAAGYRERYGRGFYATHWYWVALAGFLAFIACFLVQWAWFDHITGGEYFHAGTAADLRKVYQSLNAKFAMERQETEVSALFSAAAVLFVIFAAVLSLLWFHRSA